MDTLTIALSMSIGCAVAWLIALYSSRGPALLFWDVLFGMVGATFCALMIGWIAPMLVIIGLLTAGPICAVLAIVAGHAIRRAVGKSIRRRHSI
jgi:hypothetical protein